MTKPKLSATPDEAVFFISRDFSSTRRITQPAESAAAWQFAGWRIERERLSFQTADKHKRVAS
jgi:hypothetical protein